MGVEGEFIGHGFQQGLFDGFRCFARSHAGAIGDAENMRVDGHGRLFKNNIEYDIGGFAAYAGKLHEFISAVGHLPVIFIDQNFSHGDDVFGFVVIQADGFDVLFKAVDSESQHFLRRVGDFEQFMRGFVDAGIGSLG